MSRTDFRDRFAIVGAAVTPTAREHAPGMSSLSLEAWAAKLAIEDAGLSRNDVDGAVHTMMAAPHPPAQWIDAYSRLLGLRSSFYLNVARGGQAAHNGLLLATQALSLGQADYVVVACGLSGWSLQRSTDPNPTVIRGGTGPGMLNFGLGRLGYDAGNAATVHGFLASRHMAEFGTNEFDLGAVAVAIRQWANENPEARFYDRRMTIDDYLQSPFVVRPFRIADCCVQSDLGAALVVTTAERADSLRHPPVYLKGIGLGDSARSHWWDKSNYSQLDGGHAFAIAQKQAGVERSDIDFAEFYDCFTMEVLLYLEAYGFCDRGEAGAFVADGNLSRGGALPTNTYGGMLSAMYLFDYPGVVEAVRQLRGEAGSRQLDGVNIALTNGHGGEMVLPGMCASHAVAIMGNAIG